MSFGYGMIKPMIIRHGGLLCPLQFKTLVIPTLSDSLATREFVKAADKCTRYYVERVKRIMGVAMKRLDSIAVDESVRFDNADELFNQKAWPLSSCRLVPEAGSIVFTPPATAMFNTLVRLSEIESGYVITRMAPYGGQRVLWSSEVTFWGFRYVLSQSVPLKSRMTKDWDPCAEDLAVVWSCNREVFYVEGTDGIFYYKIDKSIRPCKLLMRFATFIEQRCMCGESFHGFSDPCVDVDWALEGSCLDPFIGAVIVESVNWELAGLVDAWARRTYVGTDFPRTIFGVVMPMVMVSVGPTCDGPHNCPDVEWELDPSFESYAHKGARGWNSDGVEVSFTTYKRLEWMEADARCDYHATGINFGPILAKRTITLNAFDNMEGREEFQEEVKREDLSGCDFRVTLADCAVKGEFRAFESLLRFHFGDVGRIILGYLDDVRFKWIGTVSHKDVVLAQRFETFYDRSPLFAYFSSSNVSGCSRRCLDRLDTNRLDLLSDEFLQDSFSAWVRGLYRRFSGVAIQGL
jgi:hypothetical protein